MSIELLDLATGDAKPSLKFTDCLGGCGEMVPYRTTKRVYCKDCREKNHLERSRVSAERQRRKNGIPKVKGVVFSCEECGSDFYSASKNGDRYCAECKGPVALRKARDASYAKDRGGLRKRVGRVEECGHCGHDFTVETNGGSHKYCTSCRELQKLGKLPHLREAIRANRRRRYREDPKFALNDLMRGGMLRTLGNKKGGESWTKFVDYTVDELRRHLERQFTRGMTWENRGEFGWHVDHILPIASFKYDSPEDPEFKACWSLANLRPLWGVENSAKKDKILYII